MVGRRGDAPLVPPYKLRRPNNAMALTRAAKGLRIPAVCGIPMPLGASGFAVGGTSFLGGF